MMRQTLSVLLLLASAPALAQTAPDPVRSAPVRAAAIRDDVRILSSDAFAGRGPGEIGEQKTLAHLQAEFAKAGLKPGGPNGSWFQDVPLTRIDRSGLRLDLRIGGRAVPLARRDDWLFGMNREGQVAIERAGIVFVGFGVDAPDLGWQDYAGVDVRGKVVMMLLNDPDYDQPTGPFGGRARSVHALNKAQKAYDRGALAVVTVHQDAPSQDRLWASSANRDPDATYRLAATPPPEGPARAAITLRDVAARRIFARAGADFDALAAAAKRPGFRAVELAGARLSIAGTTTARPFATRNILARIDGTSRRDETVVFGAHWDAYGIGPADPRGDTIRNGAVDNAIGTATLLEVARAFAKGPPTKRSLLFIGYTSEEDGLLGAYHYAAAPVRPLATTAAAFNLDPHLALPQTRSIELIGAGRSDLEDDLAAVAARQKLAIEPEQLPDEGWYNRSDHLAFAKAGVPVVYFRAGRDLAEGGRARGTALAADYNRERYHARNDVFDPSWDLAAAAQEGAVVHALGRQIADRDRWPDWRTTPEAAAYAAERAKSGGQRR